MTNAIMRAQPPLDFIPERFHPWVRRLVQGLLPGWVRWQTDLVNINVSNAAVLAHLYQGFQTGQNRFLLAFRHPAPEDAYGMAHLLWRAVPQSAKQLGIPLQPVHSHFIYDRGIPLWAGNRSEEHTSELQSLTNLVCRLLLEKKKKKKENK